MPSPLLQFILYHFLQNHMKWVIIISCWDLKTQLHVSDMLMSKNLYVEMKNINQLNLNGNLEGVYLKRSVTQKGVFIDLNCENSENLLKKVSKEKLFKQDFHWLIYDELANITKFQNLFGNFQMAVDADVIYFMPNIKILNTAENCSYITYDVYNNGYNLGGKLNMTADQEIACSKLECYRERYLSSLHENTKYENRWFLKDITMRVATVVTYLPITEPREKLLAHLQSERNLRLDGIARYGFAFLMIVVDTLQCNIFLNFTDTWSSTEVVGGVVGALVADKSADLASSPVLPSLKRIGYITPITPSGYFRQLCIFRTPRNAGIRGTVYLDPFASKSWLSFGCILLIIGLLLWLIFKLEHDQLKVFFNCIPSILTTCLISFGSACNQSSYIVPYSLSGRTIFFCLSLLTFIIYNYYTSIVVAILLGSPVKSNIKTMGQLAESNLEVALQPIGYTKAFLNFSTLPEIRSFVRNKIQSRRNPDSVWMPIEEGLRRVHKDPGFVYGTDPYSSYPIIERTYTPEEICDLNEILIRPLQVLYTHVNKNSSYLEILRLKQLRIAETGVYHRLQGIWLTNRLHCDMTSSFVVQVGLEYTAPLFILMAGAFLLALIMLLMEILWHKYLDQKYKNLS